MLRILLMTACLAAGCGSDAPGSLPENVADAELVLRRADDGTISASADVLDANGCTVVVEEAVNLNGREMTGGYSAGIDRCGQTRYLYQLHSMRLAPAFELTISGHVLATGTVD